MQDFVEFSSNNPWLVSGLLASALAVAFYELRNKARGVASLSTNLAIRIINDGAQVVDVRTAEKYAAGHITDAHNVPEQELLANPDAALKKKKKTLLVCDTGSNSGGCAAQLRKQGIDTVFSLKGGLAAWRQENLPLISDSNTKNNGD